MTDSIDATDHIGARVCNPIFFGLHIPMDAEIGLRTVKRRQARGRLTGFCCGSPAQG